MTGSDDPIPGEGPAADPGAVGQEPGSGPPDDRSGANPDEQQPSETPADDRPRVPKNATGSRGDGSRKVQYARRAADVFGGDKVGGDKHMNFFATGREHVLKPMRPALVEAARQDFVPPASWEEVLANYKRSRIVALRGRQGFGRTTAALRLLDASGADPIYHVGAADLAGLSDLLLSDDPARAANRRAVYGAGFVLDDPASLPGLGAETLRGLEAALDGTESRLVLVTAAADTALDSALLEHVVDLPDQPPDPRVILTRRLARRLGEGPARSLEGRPEIEALITAELAGVPNCAASVRLGSVLADAELAGRADPERIRTLLARYETDEFVSWFAALDDAEVRCHAVALAVLDGLPQETVARAGRYLFRRVDRRSEPGSAPAGGPSRPGAAADDDPFRLSQDVLLNALRARSRLTTASGPYGDVPARVAEYADPAYPAAVLRHVWTQHRVHDELLAWLTDLALDQAEPVRIQAATALGTLATMSFEHVCSGVLGAWAVSDGADATLRHEAVAYALRVAAADPALAKNVKDLTGGWYADGETPAGQATAARVYGLGIGAADPAAAVIALIRLLSVEDVLVAVAVGQALTDLVADVPEAAAPGLARDILERLHEALDDPETLGFAQLNFLQLAAQLVTGPPRASVADAFAADPESADTVAAGVAAVGTAAAAATTGLLRARSARIGQQGETVQWPTLLALAMPANDIRGQIVTLWRSALMSVLVSDEAGQVLGQWAGVAQSDPEIRAAFLRLVRAIAAGGERVRLTLNHLIAKWSAADHLASLDKITPILSLILKEA